LDDLGAKHVPVYKWEENVIVDGRLVTGQNPASSGLLGRKVLMLLENDKAEK
jgi:putative intracellular protease/amidase